VLAALGLDGDFNALAADDQVGRKLQDLGLTPVRKRRSKVGGTAEAASLSPSSQKAAE
jgi:hypothetical protein